MSIDHYPSTYDVEGGGGDAVFDCLETAYWRLTLGHIQMTYISDSGAVCAIGAVAVADGHERWHSDLPIHQWLSKTAIEAMSLLDAVALERHPESAKEDEWREQWHGPLEWVNEEWSEDWDKTHREILAIYEEAIARRRAWAESEAPSRELVLA